jgi:hypothetical protein
MKILKITNKNESIHIMHEEGSAGKKEMMVKINRFLTKELRAKNTELHKEVKLHNAATDGIDMHETVKELLCNISFNNHKIHKILNIPTIEKYNTLHDVEITVIEVT